MSIYFKKQPIAWAFCAVLFVQASQVFADGNASNNVEATKPIAIEPQKQDTQAVEQQKKSTTTAEQIDLIVVAKKSEAPLRNAINSKNEFVEKLHAAGYSRVRNIKGEKTRWQANALNSNGTLVKVSMQKDSGAISSSVITAK